MPYYKGLGWEESDFTVSENYYKHCISLPIYPDLTEKDQAFVICKVLEFFSYD